MSESNPPPTMYAELRDAARGVMIVTLLGALAATLLHFCTACSVKSPAERTVPMTAEQSAIVAAYQAELLECLEHGKAVKGKLGGEAGFAAYVTCADDVDRRYGR